MKLKQRVGDFRVRELLQRDYLVEQGEHRVYRVTKRKLTSDEAARILADEAGVAPSEVQLAGLKDRQGLTIQYMSVARGREVRLQTAELRVEPAGFARNALTSEHSLGNAFELTVRALRRDDLPGLRANLPLMREYGTLNYFDDQRFGNLTHGQGWIFKELCLGRHEQALRALLGARSPRDDERHRHFKEGLERHWGDWRECRDVAGRFGAHHSVFERLTKSPHDFAGAFEHIATRLKLIHLYAWQSHLWNRALVELVRGLLPPEECVPLPSEEGVLLAYRRAPPAALLARATFPLPGERLDDVRDPELRRLFEVVLEQEGLRAEQMSAAGVSGFALKGEERELFLRPGHLRVRPPEPDTLNPNLWAVRVRFELPRGSYATLVVKRLFERAPAAAVERQDASRSAPSSEFRQREGWSRPVQRDRGERDERGGERDRGRRGRGPHGTGPGRRPDPGRGR